MRTFHKDGTLPDDDDVIFVFGSNMAGFHGAGAARVAAHQFGAVHRIGVGRRGSSYAIPTKDFEIRTLPLPIIRVYVDRFVAYASENSDLTFFVTSIGCGLAGYEPAAIAPLFKGAPETCSFPDTWEERLG